MRGIVHRLWRAGMAGWLLALVMLLPASLSAQLMLELDNGISLSFESGNFNSETLSGEIFSASYYEYGDLTAEADRVLVETAGRPGEAGFVLERLEIDGLVIYGDENEEVYIDTIEARDLPVGWLMLQNPMAALAPAILNGRQTGFRLENLTALFPDEGFALQAERMVANDWRFDRLDNGAVYISQIRLDMPGIRLLPYGETSDATEFDLALAEAGLSELEMDFSGFSAVRRARSVLQSQTSLSINAENLASFAIELRFDMDESIYALSLNDEALGGDTAQLMQLLAQIRLDEANLDIRDKGLLALWARNPDLPSPDQLAEQAVFWINSYFPQTGRRLSGPLADFLYNGGSLRAKAQPAQPLPLGMMAGFLLAPDMAVQQLQLEIRQGR